MSTKNKWLIKSDYKILGPYSYEQVEDLIMKKQISIIDEIRDMQTRWLYVREVSDFKSLIEVVRADIDRKSEMTQTIQTSVTSQRTVTPVDTQGTVTGANGHTLDFSQIELPQLKSIEGAEEVTNACDLKTDRHNNKKINSIDESWSKGSNSEKKIRRPWLAFIGTFILISGIVGAWYYFTLFGPSKNDKIILQQIRKYNMYAQDEKSIELFKKLSPLSQDKILVDIIPLWPKLETSGALTSTHMLDLMTKGKVVGNERKSQYQLIKFNKAYNLGDIQNAKDALLKATDLDPSSVDAIENEALLSFSQKKYSESSKIFKKLYDQYSWGRYLYGYILSQINLKSLNAPLAFQSIDKHIRSRVDFNKELLFLQLYIIKKGISENVDLYHQYLDLFVAFPHQMAKNFRMSSLVNRTSYNWEDLEPLKQEISDLINPEDLVMININFQIEKGDYNQAFELYTASQNILNEVDKYNLEVALSYFKKNYSFIINSSIEEQKQFLSSELYFLVMHNENKSSDAMIMKYINLLMKDKQLFSNWAMLMTAKLPEDKEQIKTLINSDRIYVNDFIPYLEFKALVNE